MAVFKFSSLHPTIRRARPPDRSRCATGWPAPAGLLGPVTVVARVLEQVADGPADLSFEVTKEGTPAFDGQALRPQVTISFTENKAAGPFVELLLYLPTAAKGPVPVVLQASFTTNNLAVEDSGVKSGRIWDREKLQRVPAVDGQRFGRLNVAATVARGFGVATVNDTGGGQGGTGCAAWTGVKTWMPGLAWWNRRLAPPTT